MQTISIISSYLLPILALTLFIVGLLKKEGSFITFSIWVAVVSIFIEVRGSELKLFGNFFDYQQAFLFSLNVLTIIAALSTICFYKLKAKSLMIVIPVSLSIAFITTVGIVASINVWTNAFFFKSKHPKSAIMEVVNFNPPEYCESTYIFYRINKEKKVDYLCPYYYHSFLPKIGTLEEPPVFIEQHLGRLLQKPQ